MAEILRILFGAGLTLATAWGLGSLLLRRLHVPFTRLEAALFSFLAGSACLSFFTFLLCTVHQARRGVFLWGGAAVILWAAWQARKDPPRKNFPAGSRMWTTLFYLVFSAFFFVYFMTALAPEASPDGMGYHLGNVSRYYHNHGFVWSYHSMYSYLSHGMELLFLMAFTFGRHSAAAMTHLAFQTALPFLILCYGRRFGFPKVGLFAAILTYASPVIGLDGASAYNDLTAATLVFAVFYLLQVWDEDRDDKLLILIGLLAGFCYAVKYTIGLVIPVTVIYVWWRSRERRWRATSALVLPALAMVLPWVIRNWIWLGNPLAPFFNRWFPNPYYHAGMEAIYMEGLRHYTGIKHFWEIPVQLTLGGGLTGGLLGPVFLLAPLALLALRHRHGRRLLIAALVLAVPAYLNTGARFLIPSLPFLALSIGLGVAHTRGLLPALAIFQAIACWPPVLSTYCDPYAWRIAKVPIRAALRKEPEMDYLLRHAPDLVLKNAIELNVPRNGKIFSFSTRPEARIDRHIVASYESTLGNFCYDAMLAPIGGERPNHRQRFRFLPVDARRVRVVQAASAAVFWTVTELRVYSAGRELPRTPEWRLSASPNGWEVQLAFDNSYATRWSTWQAMSAGDFIGIDFGRPRRLDEVVLEGMHIRESHPQVEVWTDVGRWVPLTDTAEEADIDPPVGMRRAAALELKARGIDFILVSDAEFASADLRKYPGYWGVTEIASANGTRFYRID